MPTHPAEPADVTRMLAQANTGDHIALDELFRLWYAELHAIANRQMRSEQSGHTLQPTALVSEAYLRLVGSAAPPSWKDRTHFLSAAARAMRHVLVDHARARNAHKRGPGLRVTLQEGIGSQEPGIVDFLVLEDALNQLAEAEPRWARVVELRFFAGMEIEETAEALHISPITVTRDWRFAKAWLADKLGSSSGPSQA